MKRIVLLFILLLIAVFLGLWLHQNTGTLLIALRDKTIQMPLWFALLSIAIGYFFCWFCLNILTKFFHIKQAWKQLSLKWKAKQTQLNTRRGLIEFSEGNWRRAESYFSRSLTNKHSGSDTSLLAYLVAARAAQELGATERRDDYLREAQKTSPEAKMAIELTQAQLQILDEQWEQALATLNHLHSLTPNHPYVIKLLMQVFLVLKDWASLEKWLPQIQHKKILTDSELEQLENDIYSGLLMQDPKKNDADTLKLLWKKIPKFIRKRENLVIVYVTQLLAHGAYNEAEQQCRDALKNGWNNTLVELYGQCNIPDIETQLHFAESFLKYYPNNPYLLVTLGRIYMRCQLWGKAKSTFLKSVQIQPDAKVYAILAELAEKLDEKNEVNQYYKLGLMLVTEKSYSRME